MSADLAGITKLDEVNERLFYYVYENTGLLIFICVCIQTAKHWEEGKLAIVLMMK